MDDYTFAALSAHRVGLASVGWPLGPRAHRAGKWSARRALLSSVKLATWACVLSVGHVMRHSEEYRLNISGSAAACNYSSHFQGH